MTRSNGRARTRFTATSRRRGRGSVSKTFATRSEARRWLDDIEFGNGTSCKRIPFSELTLSYVSNNGHLRSISEVRRSLEIVAEKIGDISTYELYANPAILSSAVRDLCEERGVSPSTYNRYRSAVCSLVSHGEAIGVFPSADRIRKALPRKPEPNGILEEVLSDGEISRLLDRCRKSKCGYLMALVSCAIDTGMRKSEITSLSVGSVVKTDDGYDLIVTGVDGMLKNGDRQRVVPVTYGQAGGFAELLDMADLRRQHGESLFAASSVASFRRRSFRSAFEAACEASLGRKIRFHSLRHTYASRLMMSGASTRDVQELLGHKSIVQTQRYSHVNAAHLRNVISLASSRSSR